MATNQKNIQAIAIHPVSSNYLMAVLHGWGSNNQNFIDFPDLLALPNFCYLLANAPYRIDRPQIASQGGRAWYDIENRSNHKLLGESRELLLDWIKSLYPKTRIPLERTFLLGFSQGGAMSLDVGLTLPLAGICSLGGNLHYDPESTPSLSKNKNLPPVLLVHGKNDSLITTETAKKAKEKLNNIGVSVRDRELEIGDEINPPVLNLVRDFVSEIINRRYPGSESTRGQSIALRAF